MRKLIIAGTALALSLAFAGTAQADTITTTFDGFADGSVNGQDGWKADWSRTIRPSWACPEARRFGSPTLSPLTASVTCRSPRRSLGGR